MAAAPAFSQPEVLCWHTLGQNNKSSLLQLVHSLSRCKSSSFHKSCAICHDLLERRKFCCLECDFVGCVEGEHFLRHSAASGHSLFYNVHSRAFYCALCSKLFGEECFFAAAGAASCASAASFVSSPKGLYNLGNTCFLNAVLQVFLQNSLIRRLFFQHGKELTRKCSTFRLQRGIECCMTCDFDLLFAKYTLPENKASSPHFMLRSLWTSSTKALAGYTQQDAHEFFISFLNDLHSHFLRSGFVASCDGGVHSCCPVHGEFGGMLESLVTCGSCGKVSTARDPFFDLSIEVSSGLFGSQHHSHSASSASDLTHFLEQFTQTERLAEGQYFCSTCQAYPESFKRMLIEKAPVYLAIHLKRHSGQKGKVSIPLYFDASPFTTNSSGISGSPSSSENGECAEKAVFYELDAVIIHLGTMESGHYFSVVRWMDRWLKMDDAMVTVVPSSALKALFEDAYLLFYSRSS